MSNSSDKNQVENQAGDPPEPPKPFTRYFKVTRYAEPGNPDSVEYVIAHAYRLGDQFCQFTRYVEDPALGVCEHGFLVLKREHFDRIDEVLASEIAGVVTGAVRPH